MSKRTMSPEPCPTCGRPTLLGRPADNVSWDVRCDPEPLDKLGEVLALLAGRDTFCLRLHGFTRVAIDERSLFARVLSPAGKCDVDVVVEHRCDSPPDCLTHAPSVLNLKQFPRSEDYNGPCPY